MMFPTDKDAESWLLDKGVDYDDIERAFETDDVRDLPADVRRAVENVATAVTELTMPTKKVEEARYHAKSPYEIQSARLGFFIFWLLQFIDQVPAPIVKFEFCRANNVSVAGDVNGVTAGNKTASDGKPCAEC